jgi:hypothetical protein
MYGNFVSGCMCWFDMCMYMYMYIYMYIYMYMYMCMYICICMCMYMYIHMYVYTYICIYTHTCIHNTREGGDSVVGIATRYGLDGPVIDSWYGARFSTPLQTDPGAHLTNYTMSIGSFLGVKQPGRGVDRPPHLAP